MDRLAALAGLTIGVLIPPTLQTTLSCVPRLPTTRRDLQRALGDEKKPWEIGKSFDQSAPIGPIHRVADIDHIDGLPNLDIKIV